MKLWEPAGKRVKTSFPSRKSSSPVLCSSFTQRRNNNCGSRTIFDHQSASPSLNTTATSLRHIQTSFTAEAARHQMLVWVTIWSRYMYACGLSLSLPLLPPPPSSNERHLSVSSSPLTLTQSPSGLLCAGLSRCQSSLHFMFIVFGRTWSEAAWSGGESQAEILGGSAAKHSHPREPSEQTCGSTHHHLRLCSRVINISRESFSPLFPHFDICLWSRRDSLCASLCPAAGSFRSFIIRSVYLSLPLHSPIISSSNLSKLTFFFFFPHSHPFLSSQS